MFRKAELNDLEAIWTIIQQAIQKRKEEGSNQWQDGYPNPDVLREDINKEVGFVLDMDNDIAAYCAIMINDEPEYENIEGNWLTNEDFVVFHRVAISKDFIGQGLAKKCFDFIEQYALEHNIHSVKADTNFDNGPMLHLFEKCGYSYCGEVYFRGSPRKAYEKKIQ